MRKVIYTLILGALLFIAFSVSDIMLPLTSPVKLIFVGDIMLSRQIGVIMERESNYNFPYEIIANRIQTADIAFGNLENPVSLRGINQGSKYSFRVNPESLKGLNWAGFDVVSLANNHILDWGKDALSDTLVHLENVGISPAGIGETYDKAHAPARLEKNGQTFCFLAYSEFAPRNLIGDVAQTVANINKEIIIGDLMRAKGSKCGVITVSLHWGNEYEIFPMDWQRELAHTLVDNGANLIIGHHPHVVQPVERYKNGVIAYSLGNFVFDQNFSVDTQKGKMLEITVKDSVIILVEEIQIEFNKSFQPYEVEV